MGVSKSIDSGAILSSKAQELEGLSDLVLVERVQEGDLAAFDMLTRKYRARIYSIVYNITSNREDASDLTQDAFIKAFQSIQKFKKKSSFYTWLYRIVINTTLTHLRKNRLRNFFSLENLQDEVGSSDFLEAMSSDAKSDKPTFLKELQEKLNEALQTLSIKHRMVVVLHEIEGLSHQEIAQVVGCSEGTVRSRLHYAKQQLQSLLKDYTQ